MFSTRYHHNNNLKKVFTQNVPKTDTKYRIQYLQIKAVFIDIKGRKKKLPVQNFPTLFESLFWPYESSSIINYFLKRVFFVTNKSKRQTKNKRLVLLTAKF